MTKKKLEGIGTGTLDLGAALKSSLDIRGSALGIGVGAGALSLDLNAEPDKEIDPVDAVLNAKDDLEWLQDAHKSDMQLRAEKEDQRFIDATDSEYWVCVCFTNRAQVQEFLRKLGPQFDPDYKYLDGREVMKAVGMKLEAKDAEWGKVRSNKRMADLAREEPGKG